MLQENEAPRISRQLAVQEDGKVVSPTHRSPLPLKEISLVLISVELSDLYSLPNIVRVVKSRRKRWEGDVARMGDGRGVHRVLVGKPEERRPLGRPRRRWEDNIKMDLQKVGWSCGDWMELAQDRERWRALVSTVMNFRVP